MSEATSEPRSLDEIGAELEAKLAKLRTKCEHIKRVMTVICITIVVIYAVLFPTEYHNPYFHLFYSYALAVNMRIVLSRPNF